VLFSFFFMRVFYRTNAVFYDGVFYRDIAVFYERFL
jgi:hypothetical protein